MIRSTPYLQQGEYSLAINMVSEALDGDKYTLLRETSNILSFILPAGYKVFGYEYSLIKERLYLLITNPTTKFSSIGYVTAISNLTSIQDSETQCTDCDYVKILEQPLELQTQVPYSTYVELLNDLCSGAFNFDLNFPVKFSELKEEKSGTIWYITDYNNPPRNIHLDNIQQYLEKGIPCSSDVTSICVDVDKMRIFPNNLIPEIKPEILQVGGNLPEGTYEFLVAYCNYIGDEISEYYSITNPIKLFDENNLIKNQKEQNATTSFGIRLKVSNLDLSYKYYKVVVIQRTEVSGATSYFVEGVHPTTNNSVLYTSTGIQDKEENIGGIKSRTTLEKINATKPKIELTRGLVSSGDKLFHWGIVKQKEINLQPIMQFIGAQLKWNTSIAKETLYNGAIATSNYTGYMRDEVQPFGLRTLHKDGSKSAIFPLIPPPLRTLSQPIIEGSNNYTTESQLLGSEDTNLKAILKNAPSCTTNGRTKVWQVYNTAEVEGTCPSFTPSTQTISEDIIKTCTIAPVGLPIAQGSATIELDMPFVTLQQYIEDNYSEVTDPLSDKWITDISPRLVETYPLINCTPIFEEDCDMPILEGSKTFLGDISLKVDIGSLLQVGKRYLIKNLIAGDIFSNVGFIKNNQYFTAVETTPTTWISTEIFIEDVTLIESKFPEDYQDTILKNACLIYKSGDFNGVTIDPRANPFVRPPTGENKINLMPCGQLLVLRELQTTNFTVTTADVIPNLTATSGSDSVQNYFNDYDISETLSSLKEVKTAVPIASGWSDVLHKKALWFKTDTIKNKFVIEVTQQKLTAKRDNVSDGTSIRISMYAKKTSPTPFLTQIVDLSVGGKFLFEKDLLSGEFKVTNEYGGVFIVPLSQLPNAKFYIATDCKIVSQEKSVILPIYGCIDEGVGVAYRIAPTDGCYAIALREVEYSSAIINWESIQVNKTQNYKASCSYKLPRLNDCNPIPFKYGKFAYYESLDTYPDNKELYDGSDIVIKTTDIATLTTKQKTDFEADFKLSLVGTNYTLKPNTNLRCSPIRHYKMPNNNIAPFMNTNLIQNNAQSAIYPLGVTLDSNVVEVFLNIAKNNNLLTQKQRDNIVGYEILKGDNSLHKSIVGKGLLYDMYKYNDGNNLALYPNYPHNDLGQDIFNFQKGTQILIQHPYASVRNNNFTLISPDTTNRKPSLPQEMTIDGYQYGSTTPFFEDVFKHPEWVVLSNNANTTATVLAVAEQLLETIIHTTEFITQGGTGNTWITLGVSGGTNAIGAAISAAAIVAFAGAQLLNGVIKTGQKRLEWLRIIRNLGQPTNFATLNLSDGFMNKFTPNAENSEILRGLSTKKYLTGDKYTIKDENNGQSFRINNKYREHSVFLSLGQGTDVGAKENFINYPPN